MRAVDVTAEVAYSVVWVTAADPLEIRWATLIGQSCRSDHAGWVLEVAGDLPLIKDC